MRHFRQVISLENSHGAHCLYLMLERLGRRGRRKIIVKKKHFEVVQLLLLQFFSLQFPDAPEIVTLISQSSNLYFLIFFKKMVG